MNKNNDDILIITWNINGSINSIPQAFQSFHQSQPPQPIVYSMAGSPRQDSQILNRYSSATTVPVTQQSAKIKISSIQWAITAAVEAKADVLCLQETHVALKEDLNKLLSQETISK